MCSIFVTVAFLCGCYYSYSIIRQRAKYYGDLWVLGLIFLGWEWIPRIVSVKLVESCVEGQKGGKF